MNASTVPDDLDPFLDWVRASTEQAWSAWHEPSLRTWPHDTGGTDWLRGTRWLGGLTDVQIIAIESKYGLHFPREYRLFLQKLHAPDRPMFKAYFEGDSLVEGKEPSFYNWLSDDQAILQALNWPLEGLLFAFEHSNFWFDEWGPRPTSVSEGRRRIAELVRGAPRLVPVFGHRYLVEADCPRGYVVLSVYGSDIITYVGGIRALLLADLARVLEGNRHLGAVTVASDADYTAGDQIPFWGSFLR